MITIGFTLDNTQPAGSTPQVAQDRAYVIAIESAGAVPLAIPALQHEDTLRRLYEMSDALCLPGGWDVAPQQYGAEAHPSTRPIDDHVESTELQLLRWALADDKPVLAICRGLQLLNVAQGGTLIQDLPSQTVASIGHKSDSLIALAHGITIEPHSRLCDIVGAASLTVNSAHHQAISELGRGLRVSATAADGIIEAVEMPARRFVIGVQFHPEVLVGDHPWAARLFSTLATAAGNPVGAVS